MSKHCPWKKTCGHSSRGLLGEPHWDSYLLPCFPVKIISYRKDAKNMQGVITSSYFCMAWERCPCSRAGAHLLLEGLQAPAQLSAETLARLPVAVGEVPSRGLNKAPLEQRGCSWSLRCGSHPSCFCRV